MLSTLMMWITVDFLFLVALATSTPDAAGTSGSTRSGTRTFQTQLIFTHRMDLAVEEYKQGIPFNAKTMEKWIPAQDIAQMKSLLLDTFNRPPPQQEVETTADSVLVQITSVHAESQGFLLLNELPRNNNNPEVIQIEVEITYTIRGLCQGPGCTSTGMEGKHDNQDIISSGIRRLRGPGQPQPQHQLDEQIEEEQESDPMTREYHQKLQKALLQLAQSRILVKQPHSHHDTNNYVSNQTKSFMWEDLLQGIQSVRSPPPKGRHRDLQNTEALIDVVEVFCDPLVQSLEISISIDLPGDWRHLINHHDSHNNRTITIANETMTVVDALNVSFVKPTMLSYFHFVTGLILEKSLEHKPKQPPFLIPLEIPPQWPLTCWPSAGIVARTRHFFK